MQYSFRLVLAPLALAFTLTACTAPDPLTREQLVDFGKAWQPALAGQPAGVPTQWTLEQSIAWALENNLDFRMAALDAALATGNRQLASIDMLPRLTAQAGYRNRDNDLATVSESVATGQVSVVPSRSSDRESFSAGLEASWSVVDFGLAWYRAREFGEQALIAEENRRRTVHAMVRDVVQAWWRARAFQQLRPELEEMRATLEQALAQSEAITAQRLRNPVDVLEYRKSLLLILQRLDKLALELDQSRDDLARVLNLPAGVTMEMIDSSPLDMAALDAPLPDVGLPVWQSAALLNRPELRTALYEQRLAEYENKRRWLDLMPNAFISHGTNYDSNSYLVNSNWQETGAQVSWNLMKLAAIPATRRTSEMRTELARLSNEMQAAAVLSQVAIADKAYRQGRRAWCMSRTLAELDDQRTDLVGARSEAAAIDRLTLIRVRVDNLLLRTETAMQYAELQRARMTLLLSAGLLDVPPVTEGEPAAPAIRAWLDGTVQGAFTEQLAVAAQDFALPFAPVAPATGDRTCL